VAPGGTHQHHRQPEASIMLKEIPVKDLKQGDLVDLEGDQFADPHKDNVLLVDMYQEVDEIDPETDGCICVYFTNHTCAFPPDHLVRVQRD
jgi:hypothetical protein